MFAGSVHTRGQSRAFASVGTTSGQGIIRVVVVVVPADVEVPRGRFYISLF